MVKYAQLVIGPAGSGKSTYCRAMQKHFEAVKRNCHIVNLDPAAEDFEYSPSISIQDLITLDEAQEELELGPNGGLVFCMEYLLDEAWNWFVEQLGDYEEDYLIIDCPGQIELYSHLDIMQTFVERLVAEDYRVICVYIVDSTLTIDTGGFLYASLIALSGMISLSLPHINVLTKTDLLEESRRDELDKLLYPDAGMLNLMNRDAPHLTKMNLAFDRLLNDYNMVRFVPLNVMDEDSLDALLYQIDVALGFGENEDVKILE